MFLEVMQNGVLVESFSFLYNFLMMKVVITCLVELEKCAELLMLLLLIK